MQERRGYGKGRRRAAAILALAGLLTAGAAIAEPSRDVVFEGIVERVQNGTVYVNGKGIHLAGASLKNLNGKDVAFQEIVPGKYAQVHTVKGRIVQVLIFDPMPR